MYAWEKNWTYLRQSFSVSSSATVISRQQIMHRTKNLMVSQAGWTVEASSHSALYEYEGVTGGGSYGGDSTGPYDVWSNYAQIAQNTSWTMLRSPMGKTGQYHILLGMYGSGSSLSASVCFFASDMKFLEPVGSDLPLPNPLARLAGSRYNNTFWPSSSITYTLHTSACSSDGSFIIVIQKSDWSIHYAGMCSFLILDTSGISGYLPVVLTGDINSAYRAIWAMDLHSVFGLHLTNWDDWTAQTPKVRYPYRGGLACFPCRGYNTLVQSTDFPLDFEGKMSIFPAHFIRTWSVYYSQSGISGSDPATSAYVGRAPDLYLAPDVLKAVLDRGDVIVDSNDDIRYYFASIGVRGSDVDYDRELKLWIPSPSSPV